MPTARHARLGSRAPQVEPVEATAARAGSRPCGHLDKLDERCCRLVGASPMSDHGCIQVTRDPVVAGGGQDLEGYAVAGVGDPGSLGGAVGELGAARVEAAAGGDPAGVRDLALEHDGPQVLDL